MRDMLPRQLPFGWKADIGSDQHVGPAFDVSVADVMKCSGVVIVTERVPQIRIIVEILIRIERVATAPLMEASCIEMEGPGLLVCTERADQVVISGYILDSVEGF